MDHPLESGARLAERARMRALSALGVLSVGVLVACVPDRSDSDADTPTPPRYTCDGPIGKRLVAGFHPAEGVDYVAWRTESFRVEADPPSTVILIDESGTPNEVARALVDEKRYCDAERCPKTDLPWQLDGRGAWTLYCTGATAEVGGVEPGGYSVNTLVVARGDDVSLVTTHDELVSFFGTIDTKSEAVFLALRDGFTLASCNYGGMEERADGYALRIPVPGGCERAPDGPAHGSEEITLFITRDGHTRIESRKTLPEGVLRESR